MKVIDISAWQEDVDWQAVKDAGIEGVIIKLGERDHLDDMFIEHVNNAVKYGLRYGVYYFSHAYDIPSALDEAKQVDAWLKEYLRGENPELVIWFDAEAAGMLSGDVTATCSAFITHLNAVGYNYVGIYASWNWLSKDGAHHIDMDALADYVPYWVAQYARHNDLTEEYPDKYIRMWQYTDHYSDDLPYDCSIYYE